MLMRTLRLFWTIALTAAALLVGCGKGDPPRVPEESASSTGQKFRVVPEDPGADIHDGRPLELLGIAAGIHRDLLPGLLDQLGYAYHVDEGTGIVHLEGLSVWGDEPEEISIEFGKSDRIKQFMVVTDVPLAAIQKKILEEYNTEEAYYGAMSMGEIYWTWKHGQNRPYTLLRVLTLPDGRTQVVQFDDRFLN